MKSRRTDGSRRERPTIHWLAAGLAAGMILAGGAGTPMDGAAGRGSTTSGADPTPEMPEIVERSIAFHGGEVLEHAEVELTLRSLSGAARIEAWTDGPLFDYTVTAPTRDGERKVRYTNREGENRVFLWRDGEPVELSGDEADGYRDWLMAKVYFPFLPFRLADPSVYFVDRGLETWGDRELHRVKVTFTPGSSTHAEDQYAYWFDPETGRMEQFAYSFHTGDGGLRLRRATDFERVGGVLFSDQENLGVNGPGHSVDQVDAGFAEDEMEPVSTVEVEDIEVRELE